MNLKRFADVCLSAARTADQAVQDAAMKAANEVVDRLRTENWKERTGNTNRNTRATPNPDGATVTIDVEHATVLDEGSPPHRIVARNAKALGPMMGGRFFKSVNHPGTKGFHFSEKELERGGQKIEAELGEWARSRLGDK